MMRTEATRCKQQVTDTLGWHFYPCGRKAIRDGFCRIHHPEERAARAAKRGPTKFERELTQMASNRAVDAAREQVVSAARAYLGGTGHDGHIREALEKLDALLQEEKP